MNSKKVILLITNLDLSINNGATRHFIDDYTAFKNSGLKVRVLARKIRNQNFNEIFDDIDLVPTFYFKRLRALGTFAMVLVFEFFLFFKLLIQNFREPVKGIYLRESILNFGAYLYSKLFNKSFVIETNNLLLEDLKESGKYKLIPLARYFQRLNFRNAKKIICVTENMKKYFIENYTTDSSKLVVIPNGFHFERLRNNFSKFENNGSVSHLLYLGGLHQREGVQVLINAMSLLKGKSYANLIIVGDGPYRGELEEMVGNLKLEGIIKFSGAVSGEKVGTYIEQANICVAPLIAERNITTGVSPVKVYEYLAYKKPLITSRIPGLEFIENETAGLQFEPDDLGDLAKKIDWLTNHPIEAQQMAENGYRYVKENHDWNKLSQEMISVSLGAYETS